MKSHIPISSNPENWWQKSRIFYLKHFLKNIEKKDDFNILEIGPGFGLNVNTLSQFGKVDIAETETHFLKYLKDKKSDQIRNFFDEVYDIPDNQYDFIVLMDVLEHIPDHEIKTFVNKIISLGKPQSHIFLSVPAHQYLFSEMDVSVGHYRRYSWKLLNKHICKYYKRVSSFGFNYLLFLIRVIQIKYSRNIKKEVEVSNILNKILYLILKIEYFLFLIKFRPKFGLSYFFIGKNSKNK